MTTDLAFWDREPRDADGRWTRLAGAMKTSGGFTSFPSGESPTTGFVVGVPHKRGKDWQTLPHGTTTAADIQKFAEKHAKELAKPGRAIGGWSNADPSLGDVRDALDIVHVYDNEGDAAHAAYDNEQDAYFNLQAGTESTPTAYYDRLRAALPKPFDKRGEKDPWADMNYFDSQKQGPYKVPGVEKPTKQQLADWKRHLELLDQARRSEAWSRTLRKHGGNVNGPEWGGHYMTKELKLMDEEDAMKRQRAALFGGSLAKELTDMSVQTPFLDGAYDVELSDGKLAFWKQILPKRTVHYTAKDGSRQVLDFNEQFLTELSQNKAVDKVGFLLADTDNRHTMDPERLRGTVEAWDLRDDGLYGKIVFPNREAAQAVLSNPDLGVSARIRADIPKDDGSTVSRGIVHVLGTLDPQIGGMAPWQPADLSSEQDDLLDLTSETYEDGSTMAEQTRSVTDYTEAEIEAMDEATYKSFLEQFEAEYAGILDAVDDLDELPEPEMETASLSNEAKQQIDLANTRVLAVQKELAQARWERTRDLYLAAGVAPADLDLAEPIFNRPSDFVVDLSNEGTEGSVDVAKIVRGLLDSLKGTVDLSAEAGHSGTFKSGDGEDPDKALLDAWEASQGS